MIIKDNIPVDAAFRSGSSDDAMAFVSPPSGKLARRRRYMALYVFAGLSSFMAIVSAVLLTGTPQAIALQQIPSSSHNVSTVSKDISEDVSRPLNLITPASGAETMTKSPAIAQMPPQPTPSSPPPVVAEVPSLPPASAPSESTSPKTAPSAPPTSDQGASASSGVTVPPGEEKDDIYYDSLPLPPKGVMAKAAGPREVNPVLEPAQKFVIVKKSKDADALESLLVSANRALVLGRYDAAMDMFSQMYKKNPRDPRVLMGRAVSLQRVGRREAALAAYEDLLHVDPNNIEAQINKAGLLGEEYPAVALRNLLDLRERFPGNAGLAAQIGLMEAKLGNDAEALQYLGSAASLDPANAEHVYNMAVVSDRMGNVSKAISLYEQALQMDASDTEGARISRDAVYARLSVLRNTKK